MSPDSKASRNEHGGSQEVYPTVVEMRLLHDRQRSRSTCKPGKHEHGNQIATLWALGTAVMAFLGAGVWGFIHTLAPVNYYTHGSQITAAHGHLAFFGAYAMVVLCIISYAMPIMRGRPQGNSAAAQKLETFAFWAMCISMLGITLALTVAGVWQVALQRLPEVGALSFMNTQAKLMPVYWVRELFGLLFLGGLVSYLASFFVGGVKTVEPLHYEVKPVTAGVTATTASASTAAPASCCGSCSN